MTLIRAASADATRSNSSAQKAPDAATDGAQSGKVAPQNGLKAADQVSLSLEAKAATGGETKDSGGDALVGVPYRSTLRTFSTNSGSATILLWDPPIPKAGESGTSG